MTEFIGFTRPDGFIGIRDHVIVIALDREAANVCHKVAGLVKKAVVVLYNPEQGIRLQEVAGHPNVAGSVVVMGGEREETADSLALDLERLGKPYKVIELHGLDPVEAISKVIQTTAEMVRDVSPERRELVKSSKLLPVLLHVSAELMLEVLPGFVRLIIEENSRCLWIEKDTGERRALSPDLNRHVAGDLNPGQRLMTGPGIYRYTGPKKDDAKLKAIFQSRAQVILFPVEERRLAAHALIPEVGFVADRAPASSEISYLDLGWVEGKGLTSEEAGLLLFSEVLATASGKLTKDEIIKDTLII